MIIWIIAAVILVALAAIAYTQGAIKTSITTVGLIIGAALCVPLAPLLHPVFDKLGASNPLLGIFISPVLVLAAIMIATQVVASLAYRKMENHYKYHEAEIRYTLWTRTDARFGIVFAVFNAMIYTVLICVLIWVMGYPAVQLSSGEGDPAKMRYLVNAAKALKETRMDRVVAAFDPAPKRYYQACDLLGTIYRNPSAWDRFSAYPPMLLLGQRDEFQALAHDVQFNQKLQAQPPLPLVELAQEPKLQAITGNRELVNQIFDMIMKLDFNDVSNYLWTGKSEKYADEKILGRWEFSPEASIKLIPKVNPKITRPELIKLMHYFQKEIAKITLTALEDKQLIMRLSSAPSADAGPDAPVEVEVVKGEWNNTGVGKYDLNGFGDSQSVTTDGDRMQVKRDGKVLVFYHEL